MPLDSTGPSNVKGELNMDLKLEVLVLPVSDVDRAKSFYGERRGTLADRPLL